jgi:hypothetical protein
VTVGVATTKGFDLLLVVHALLAIASLVVLLVLRSAAAAAVGARLTAATMRSFSGRRELAGRVVHLVPLSGLGLLVLSRGAYDLSTGFVVVGIGAWFVAAASLEAVAFPAQHEVATSLLAHRSVAEAARRLQLGVEVAALAIVVAAIVMIAGTAI